MNNHSISQHHKRYRRSFLLFLAQTAIEYLVWDCFFGLITLFALHRPKTNRHDELHSDRFQAWEDGIIRGEAEDQLIIYPTLFCSGWRKRASESFCSRDAWANKPPLFSISKPDETVIILGYVVFAGFPPNAGLRAWLRGSKSVSPRLVHLSDPEKKSSIIPGASDLCWNVLVITKLKMPPTYNREASCKSNYKEELAYCKLLFSGLIYLSPFSSRTTNWVSGFMWHLKSCFSAWQFPVFPLLISQPVLSAHLSF